MLITFRLDETNLVPLVTLPLDSSSLFLFIVDNNCFTLPPILPVSRINFSTSFACKNQSNNSRFM